LKRNLINERKKILKEEEIKKRNVRVGHTQIIGPIVVGGHQEKTPEMVLLSKTGGEKVGKKFSGTNGN